MRSKYGLSGMGSGRHRIWGSIQSESEDNTENTTERGYLHVEGYDRMRFFASAMDTRLFEPAAPG
jgi:hypothetical protein